MALEEDARIRMQLCALNWPVDHQATFPLLTVSYNSIVAILSLLTIHKDQKTIKHTNENSDI